jgi:toxin ParE1/3/4
MNLFVFFTPKAQSDLKDIYRYSAENFGLDQADSYTRDIEAAADLIHDHPHLGRDRSAVREGYFCFPVRQHMLWYRKTDAGIEIVRILHAAMDPQRQL